MEIFPHLRDQSKKQADNSIIDIKSLLRELSYEARLGRQYDDMDVLCASWWVLKGRMGGY